MSHHRYTSTSNEFATPSSSLHGASRPGSNPRLHTSTRPYGRPASLIGPSSSSVALNGNAITNGEHEPTMASPSNGIRQRGGTLSRLTRTMPHSVSTNTLSTIASGMTRSSSDPSLSTRGSHGGILNGIKSMFSRPLQWLATPSRGGARVPDVEDADSPVAPARRQAPTNDTSRPVENGINGDYAPQTHVNTLPSSNAQSYRNRPNAGPMLPPLPPDVSLSAARRNRSSQTPVETTNYSRPITSPTSRPIHDPPTSLFSPVRPGSTRTSRVLTSTRRNTADANMNGMDEDMEDELGEIRFGGRDTQTWRPRTRNEREATGSTGAQRTPGRGAAARVPASAGRTSTPRRQSEQANHVFPSTSPFQTAQSPRSPSQRATTGLSRVNTTTAAAGAGFRHTRNNSMLSDASMGGSSTRNANTRRTGSLLFQQEPAPAANQRANDDGMSVDEQAGEGSALGWFSRGTQSGSPAARASSQRTGSPALGGPRIRQGQMVWDADRGFVREKDLQKETGTGLVGKNEAEKILFALEAQRTTPLQQARSDIPFASGGPLPADLVGASSRTLRKAISVPLATALSGETVRGKRDRERAEDKKDGVSMMVSPYGRRRQVNDASRKAVWDEKHKKAAFSDEEEAAAAVEAKRKRMDAERMDHANDGEEGNAPPTPRRSSRLRGREESHEPEETSAKTRKTKKGKVAAESSSKDRKGKGRRQRSTVSPDPAASTSAVPPVPAVPTITETAPSPETRDPTYQPRAEGEMAKEKSNLRARTELTKRQHEHSAASRSNSRASSPSNGRFSAREEDLPPMDQLQQSKIPFNSFSGISFGNMATSSGQAGPATQPTKSASSTSPPESPTSPTKSTSSLPHGETASSLLSRLGPPPDKSSPNPSLSVPAASSRLPTDPHGRLVSPRLRASSPLASSSIVPEPDTPPETPPVASTAAGTNKPSEAQDPPAGGIFRLGGTEPAVSTTPTSAPPANLFAGVGTASTKEAGLGIGRPSSALSNREETTTSGPMPEFFGRTSQPGSGASSPTKVPPTFSFGQPSQSSQPADTGSTSQPPSSGFSFSQPKAPESGPTEASQPNPASTGFGFGQTKPAEPSTSSQPATSAFSFGQPKTAETATSDNQQKDSAQEKPPSTGFTFVQPQQAASSSVAPASGFTFGQQPNGDSSKSEASKPGFSFGYPTMEPIGSPAQAAAVMAPPAKKPLLNFGSASAPSTAESTTPSSGFSFSQPQATNSSAPAAQTPPSMLFGKQVNSTPASTGSTLGKRGADGDADGSSQPAFKFKSSTEMNGNAETPKTFPFGQASNPKPAESAQSNPFGSPSTSSNLFGESSVAPATSLGFTFSKPVETITSSTPGFGSQPTGRSTFGSTQPNGASGAEVKSTSFGFGNNSAAPASNFGGFGQSSTTGNTQMNGISSTFGVNGTPASQPPSTGMSTLGQTPSQPASNGFGNNTFGQNSNASGGFGQPAPSSTFGGFGQAAAPSTGGFGQPATPSTGGFGQAATNTPAANPFNASNSGTPGSAAPTPSNSSFAFTFTATPDGSPSSFGNAQQPSANGSAPFVFGASPAASPSSFSFGNAAQSSSSSQPFVFTAGGIGSGMPNGGQTQRFSSPAAENQNPGGFNMGVAPPPEPGSPSGRKIKPLRRSAVRR